MEIRETASPNPYGIVMISKEPKPSFATATAKTRMMPIKSEPMENPPETKARGIKYLLDIKSEINEYPPDVKSESFEYTPEIPPIKRLKTLSSTPTSPSLKGKSIVEKEEGDDDPLCERQLDTCGVCLLEEGMSRRGFIDSCEHYFCFVCIMEWAKVESRCPICKRRFSTIRRPQDGVFRPERIVNVPVRDQVYCLNGNATLGPSDPYSQVKCSICSLSSDDHLLLLCDLCDSAAHSYCVGLGATVPEGDWFCQDCTFSRDEHAKVEKDTTSDNDTTCPSNFSIKDIVRESPMAPSFSQSQRVPPVESSLKTSNARTLQRCVNVHARIKVLRENWDGFRGGSLNFSSTFGDKGKRSQEQSSFLNQESSSNVDRAWKMMDMAAKALGKKHGNSKDLKLPLKKERLPNEAKKVRPNNNSFGSFKKHDNGCASRNKDDNCRIQNHGEREIPSSRKIISSTHVKNCVKKEIDSGFKENGSMKRETQVDSNVKKVDEKAKSEIQALVKLNLKILSKEKKFESGVFKEVARHATHSIMASCGIERPKARFRSFERLVCDHNETRKRPSSTLMPTCCRECFFVFVKDVVTAIAFDTS